MLNAVRTIRSVYVVVAGQSGKRALTVEEQEATVSSNVNLGKLRAFLLSDPSFLFCTC